MLTLAGNERTQQRSEPGLLDADPEVSARQRSRIRRSLRRSLPLLQHRLAMAENSAQGRDPESALPSIESMAREIARLLADARRTLS